MFKFEFIYISMMPTDALEHAIANLARQSRKADGRMRRWCKCDVCSRHRRAGSLLYTTSRRWDELGVIQQNIQLAQHKAYGACAYKGLPFVPRDLSEAQLEKYHMLWK